MGILSKDYNPEKNEFLTLGKDVVRSKVTDVVICKLDKYFKQYNHEAIVTSIVRTPEKQLSIIVDYCIKYGVPVSTDWDVDKKIGEYYCWQKSWSRLLNLGVIINPPYAAVCLEDYYKNGVNKKGQVINPSPHFFGKAFDIGGGINGINDELEIISYAMGQDKNLGILKIVLERANNCVHCDCK